MITETEYLHKRLVILEQLTVDLIEVVKATSPEVSTALNLPLETAALAVQSLQAAVEKQIVIDKGRRILVNQ